MSAPVATDLGVLGELAGALGLVDGDGALNESWLSDPGSYLSSVLADEDQRHALVAFVDDVLGGEERTTDPDGLVWLPIVDEDDPDLTISIVLDEQPAAYVGIGVGMRVATTDPASETTLHVPLFRAGKKDRPAGPLDPLLLGTSDGVVRLTTEITVDPAAPVPGTAHLGAVGLEVRVPTGAGGPDPSFGLTLRALQMPGANAARDLAIGAGALDELDDAALDLVLGLVRAQAAGLPDGPLTALAGLLGLRDGTAVPALPFEELATSGVRALSPWLEDIVRDTAKRTAWLGELAKLVDGTVAGDEVTLSLGIAALTLGVRAATGTDGHTRLTPSVGLKVTASADAVVRADADLCTVDLGAGAAVALPRLALQLVLGKRPDGGSVLIDETGPPAVRVETLRAGIALDEQHRPTLVVAADKVTIGSHEHDTLDLSSPDAVADAGGVVLGDVADEVLDRLGPAGDAVRALLGLAHPTGHPEVPTLDVGRFLQDPLGAVAEHWQGVVRDHPVAITALLETLRDLMADAAGAAIDVQGTGATDAPWRIVLADPVELEAWVEGETLTFGPAARLVVDTLGHGCTRVDTVVRVSAVALDLAGRHATFLPGVEATVELRATDRPQAALITGRMAITADHIGFAARWTPGGGLAVGFEAPGLAIDFGAGPLPVPLPVIDADGNVGLDAEGWAELERLLGALAAAAGPPFLAELAEALGWLPRLRPPDAAAHLRLAELIADPGAEVERWLGSLAVRDTELLHTALSMLARLTAGTRDGGAGPLPGSGRPDDPWLVPLAPLAGAPALAVWVTPDGPPAARDTTPTVIEPWRPGLDGLDARSLADALAFEAIAADDVRDLLAGRPDVAGGLEALVTRWAGTDGRVVPPDTDPAGVTVVRVPDATAADLPGMVDVAELLGREPATVVRVAVAAPDALAWIVEDGIPADRVIDLTTPGLAPGAFTPPAAAAGEWYVALGGRQAARLASGDADGVQGQAERLGRVLDAFAGLPGGLVVVAEAAAGHAARRAAEAAAAVTDLVSLGTPLGPVSFAVLDTQPAADALRLLARLLPARNEDLGDDPDLARGRGLVEGLVALLDLDDPARELAAPSPLPGAPRADLTVTAVFGVVDEAAVRRAQTAIVAAGMAQRDQARAAAAPTETAQALRVAVRIAVPTGAPSTGDVTVDGFVQVDVAGLGVSDAGALTLLHDRTLTAHVALGRSGMWLAGGPDPGRAPGLRPEHELRRLSLDVALPVGAGAPAAHALLTLHEPRTFGIARERWIVQPADATAPPGVDAVTTALPEVRVLLSAAADALGAATTGPAAGAVAALRALGLLAPTGGSVPDAIDHLLHEPAAHVRAVLDAAAERQALVAALRAIAGDTGAGGATPDELTLQLGPVGLTADLAARRLTLSGSATPAEAGVVAWSGRFTLDATDAASGEIALGGAGATVAGGVELVLTSGPPATLVVRRHLPGSAPAHEVRLWPDPDPGEVARTVARVVPAELTRVALEIVRDLDETARPIVDAALDAIGMLGAANADGARRVLLPVALFDDPLAWFADEAALGGAGGLQPARLVALLDALKPLLGVAGDPGVWELVAGVTVHADAGAGGAARLSLALDTTAFDADPAATARLVAGGAFSLTLPASLAPRVGVEVFVGLDGTPPDRQAVHVAYDGGSDLRVFLRPASGADLPLYPNAVGLGQLAETAVTQALPFLLDAVADHATDAGVIGEAGTLVAELGDALALRSAGHFSADALRAWAADPAAALVARLPALTATVLDTIAEAIAPLLPGSVGADVDAGALRVVVGAATVRVTPVPFAVAVSGTVTGIPAVDRVAVGLALDEQGLAALDIEVGPADIDAGGIVLRPFAGVHAGRVPAGGRRVELALSLGDDRRVGARWLLGGSLDLVVVDTTGEHLDPADVAVALLEAVLDLVAGFVLDAPVIVAVLDTEHVGTATIRDVMKGVVLADADAHQLDTRLFDPTKLLARLQRLALNVAEGSPSVTIDGSLVLGLSADGGATKSLGLRVSLAKPVKLVDSEDITISLETDARWIREPGGVTVPDGIVIDVLTVGPAAGDFAFAPGFSVNGVGLRFGARDGPLVDTALTIGSVAVYGFGRVEAGDRAGGVQVQLSDLAVGVGGAQGGNPIAQGIMSDSGSGPAKLAPKFSPAIAVQKHGTDPVLVSLRAGDGDGPWWLAIQRGFGPLYIEQVGFGVTVRQDQLERISLLLDGRVSLFGLTAAVDDLQLTFVVASNASVLDPSRWAVDLGGLAISSDLAGLTLQGGLKKFGSGDTVQYIGMLMARFGTYGLSVFGGYGQGIADGQKFTSFFAFGAINGPIGGPPAFFITGLGGGLGINRALVIPTDLSRFDQYPFIKALDPGAKPSDDPMAELDALNGYFPIAHGSFWFAAGISFNSFALIDGVVVVSVEVGDGLQIALLGLARVALPRPQVALVSIELGLVARFSTKEGVLWVQAQLTDNSWLLYEDVRLTGGFAFVTWYKGDKAGQVVLTMGGYHPRFNRPGYPQVPRLGLQWRVSDAIIVKGEQYFALTSEAIMAGGRLELSAEFGPAWAHIVFGADGIVYYEPGRYEVDVYASIAAGVTVDFWIGSVTFSISIGANIHVEGPKFHGEATFSVGPVDLTVPFGEREQTPNQWLPWAEFVRKYLEEAAEGVARVVTAIPGRGALPPGTGPGGATDTGTADGTAAKPFEVYAEFEIMVTTAVPNRRIDLGATRLPVTPSSGLGIAPMGVADAATALSLTLVGPEGDQTAAFGHDLHHGPAFPKGVWGLPQPSDDRKVPAGEVIEAIDGVRLFTVADISAGLPPIDYHRTETGDRLPLPFVNEDANRPDFIAAADDLATLLPPDTGDAGVFAVGGQWMARAGQGATALAALRGERNAPPRFGSLTDGLAPKTARDPKIDLPETRPPTPVDTAVAAPVAIAVLTSTVAVADASFARTTVKDHGGALVTAGPTLAGVQAALDLPVPAQLHRLGGVEGAVQDGTVVASGRAPLSRLAMGATAATGGRDAVADGRDRLAGMTAALAGRRGAAAASTTVGAGEIAVLRLPNAERDVGDGERPQLLVSGGGARVVALAHGGAVLADATTDPAANPAAVALAPGTERLAVAVAGEDRADAPGLLGWHAGTELAYLGWGTALAAGATVRAEGTGVRSNRHRRTAGWVRGAELVAGTAIVATRFGVPVRVVVVALDDPVDTDAGRGLSLGLDGATVRTGSDGSPATPRSVVRANRTLLIYDVVPDEGTAAVTVSVASQDGWHLAGVLGSLRSAADAADLLSERGLDAAVRAPLPGTGGARGLAWSDPSAPAPKAQPRRRRR